MCIPYTDPLIRYLYFSFQVDVYIYEPNGIKSVTAPNTLGEQFADLSKITQTKDKAHIVFKPTLQQQRKCENCTESAVDGVFTVIYDVQRESNAGELQVRIYTLTFIFYN